MRGLDSIKEEEKIIAGVSGIEPDILHWKGILWNWKKRYWPSAKHEKGTSQYIRYERMTAPMDLAKILIEEELKRSGETDGRSNS